MEILCPGCGAPLSSPDDVCPRCALAQAIPPVVQTVPAGLDGSHPAEHRLPVALDRDVQHSLRMLLVIGVGLTLLVFAVIALLVWIFFGG